MQDGHHFIKIEPQAAPLGSCFVVRDEVFLRHSINRPSRNAERGEGCCRHQSFVFVLHEASVGYAALERMNARRVQLYQESGNVSRTFPTHF